MNVAIELRLPISEENSLAKYVVKDVFLNNCAKVLPAGGYGVLAWRYDEWKAKIWIAHYYITSTAQRSQSSDIPVQP
nr:hypothetical protein [Candidatus Competibacter denitrificans]